VYNSEAANPVVAVLIIFITLYVVHHILTIAFA